MKGKMIIFIILLTLLIGTAYAGNNTTENNTPYENNTITNNTITDKPDEQEIKNPIVSLETNKKTGYPIVLLLTSILFIFIIRIRK